jgi:hypothetical protein
LLKKRNENGIRRNQWVASAGQRVSMLEDSAK